MVWHLVDRIFLIVGIIFLIAIIDTLLVVTKKDQYIRWVNFLGMAIVLSIVIQELFSFLSQLKRLLRGFY